MDPLLAEFVGTLLIIFFGCGVVANVLLSQTKGNSSGWLVITMGWAMAVFVGVYAVAKYSGAHLNPAVTIASAVATSDWSKLMYIPMQFLGAIVGAVLVWLTYKQHFDVTNDADAKLAVFCNTPAIKNNFYNFLTETIITCIFVLAVFFINNSNKNIALGALDALPVALLVLAIGLSGGGPTGYAINPARDLGPRIAHFILPIKNKRNSNWAYSWIPVLAPLCGAIIAGLLKKYFFY